MPTTFNLLHEKVQRYIHRERWKNFRPIQDDAIQVLTQSSSHLLICAPTASGKTEAAFLPIVSKIADDFSPSFRAIYISPLKALINDQFRRIDLMCKDIGIPVTRWHGDVSQGVKTKAAMNPEGILLITPESLEAMLVLKGGLVRAMFARLGWVVIDEIHSFIGAERGAQLRSLLSRIEEEAGVAPVRIGLSATVGNPEGSARWMVSRGEVAVIEDKAWDDAGVEGIVRGFKGSGLSGEEDEQIEGGGTSTQLIENLCESFRTGKNLIFGNSKKHLEEVCVKASSRAKEKGFDSTYLIHHGSLSKETRERAETTIKSSSGNVSILCTSTLEMGIDIGAVEKIGVIDPPWSVSAFAQRVGRSGRREGTNRRFECFAQQDALNSESRLDQLLREDLVKVVAIVLLYLEGFKEPLRTDRVHASTLVHQILSFITQKSGASIDQIRATVAKEGFRGLLADSELDPLITHLIEKGLLYRESSGLLLPGRIGEKLVEHYEFYAVFMAAEQWSVVCDGTEIGNVPVIQQYRPNDRLLLGGRLWNVVDVNDHSKRLTVVPAKRAKAPLFQSAFGSTNRRIHEVMREVYGSSEEYVFLDPVAQELLGEARDNFKPHRTSTGIDRTVIPIFEGTAIQNTVWAALKAQEIESGLTEVCLVFDHPVPDWDIRTQNYLKTAGSAAEFVGKLKRSSKEIEKYDRFLPDWLLDRSYAEAFVDIDGAIKWLGSLRK